MLVDLINARGQQLQLYIHERGEELLIVARMTKYAVESFTVDTGLESNFVKAEFSFAAKSYQVHH
jgi:hypothetical protein